MTQVASLSSTGLDGFPPHYCACSEQNNSASLVEDDDDDDDESPLSLQKAAVAHGPERRQSTTIQASKGPRRMCVIGDAEAESVIHSG